jgi:hypothetical protein
VTVQEGLEQLSAVRFRTLSAESSNFRSASATFALLDEPPEETEEPADIGGAPDDIGGAPRKSSGRVKICRPLVTSGSPAS